MVGGREGVCLKILIKMHTGGVLPHAGEAAMVCQWSIGRIPVGPERTAYTSRKGWSDAVLEEAGRQGSPVGEGDIQLRRENPGCGVGRTFPIKVRQCLRLIVTEGARRVVDFVGL